MDLGLTGKIAAVTGSSRGMGNAIAQALADEGCNVALSALHEERLAEAVKEIEAKGVKAIGVQCDVSTSEGCKKFIEAAVAEFGGLDILVGSGAGMTPGTLDTLTDEQWTGIVNGALLTHVWSAKFAIPHLKKSKAGRILMVSGVTGRQLLPGALATTLPNAAIIGLCKQLANDLGPFGITVNNICPGFTNTQSWGPRAEALAKIRNTTPDAVREGIAALTMLGRWGEPEEMGQVAAFMVSERNAYMTGTTVEVCGGFTKYL